MENITKEKTCQEASKTKSEKVPEGTFEDRLKILEDEMAELKSLYMKQFVNCDWEKAFSKIVFNPLCP